MNKPTYEEAIQKMAKALCAQAVQSNTQGAWFPGMNAQLIAQEWGKWIPDATAAAEAINLRGLLEPHT